MKGQQPEATRGKNSAESWFDSHGSKAAREWLSRRQGDAGKDPLSDEYVKAFLDELKRLDRLVALDAQIP